MLLKSRASPDMLPLSHCNKKRHAIRQMNRTAFPMTLSILSYDIGKYVWQRTYQHTVIILTWDTLENIEEFLVILRTLCSTMYRYSIIKRNANFSSFLPAQSSVAIH
jgi:hypothetical protein